MPSNPMSIQTKGAAPEEGCSEVIRPPLPAGAFQEEDSHEESSPPFSVLTKGAAQEEICHEVSFSDPSPFQPTFLLDSLSLSQIG